MEPLSFENKIDVSAVYDTMGRLRQELAKVIVGQEEAVEFLLAGVLADGHILLEGVPGVAKTLTAKLLARCIDVDFSRIQFTPDLMPSDVMGTNIYNPKTTEFEFRKGPVFGNIILIDEINRAPAKTQAALFEVMEERKITIDGHSYQMDPPFLVIATQNPVEHEGTYQLPEAQLDRFAFKLTVHYPELEDEVEILRRHQNNTTMHELIEQVQKVLSREELSNLRALVRSVKVDENILKYIAKIINSTRDNPDLFLGASPRASVTLLNTSKALATLRGRDFVTPDDVVHLAPAVLRHRIQLTPEKEMEGATPEDIIEQIIKDIEVPR
jgi:MoxR-like ATPase